MIRIRRLLGLLLFMPFTGLAQDSLSRGTYVRIVSENDGYQLRTRDVTDRYFTNGLRLDFIGNYWYRWPTRYLLLSFPAQSERKDDRLYSLSVGQEMYTPRRLDQSRPSLYPYDRPYAGYLYLAWKLTTVDATRSRRLASAITLGVLGPPSLADRTQMALHKLLRQPKPMGWTNQIKTDVAISYNLQLENRLFGYLGPNLDLMGAVEANLGTLSNYMGVGCHLRLGFFTDYFTSVTGFYERGKKTTDRRFQVYGFVRPAYRSVLDNTLLQGGWINGRRNTYALPANEMEHFYAQADYGLVLAYRGIQLSVAKTIRGREYSTGEQQQWGRLSLFWRAHQE
ncbi:MAG: lipid A deacylase LpxR family protein [Bacteroidetes bacterium]|nr:lipid A deacylase LpxR family protein [Fibrella sp.]